MFPRLIQIGSFYLPTYGVILAIAYLVGIWMLRRKARDEGLPEQKIFDFSLYVLAAAILGSEGAFSSSSSGSTTRATRAASSKSSAPEASSTAA